MFVYVEGGGEGEVEHEQSITNEEKWGEFWN